MKYRVKYLPALTGAYGFGETFDPERLVSPWDALDEALIADYPWTDSYPARFFAAARVGLGENGLNVLMYSDEAPLISRETRFGGATCDDSCLEFFVTPFPEDGDKYLNVEINPSGIAHVGAGDGRFGRLVYDKPIENFEIKTFARGRFWAVSYVIPNALFVSQFGKAPKAGQHMRGNFYKCSGSLLHEHYGTWNHVNAPRPDFHRPECFGEFIIE